MSREPDQPVMLETLLHPGQGPRPHGLGSLLQPAVSPPEEGLAGALLVGGGEDRGVGGAERGVLWCGGPLAVTSKTNVVNLHLSVVFLPVESTLHFPLVDVFPLRPGRRRGWRSSHLVTRGRGLSSCRPSLSPLLHLRPLNSLEGEISRLCSHWSSQLSYAIKNH